jgi:hypothetical protein
MNLGINGKHNNRYTTENNLNTFTLDEPPAAGSWKYYAPS